MRPGARSCDRAAQTSCSSREIPRAALTSSDDSPMCLPGEGRPEAVVDHRVDDISGPAAGAPPHAWQQVRGVGHRLHPARDDGLDLPGADHLIGEAQCGQAGQADVVQRDGGRLAREARGDRGLASRICPAPACRTWPMTTHSMVSGGTAARVTADAIAAAPRSTAVMVRRPAPYLPTGVRAAETITDRVMAQSSSQRSVELAPRAAGCRSRNFSSSVRDHTRSRLRRWLARRASTRPWSAFQWRSGRRTCRLPCSSAPARRGTSTRPAVHTLEAYLDERGIDRASVDPIPIQTFLDYCEWFRTEKQLAIREEFVTGLARTNGGFQATLAGGEQIEARAVVCAPGIRRLRPPPRMGIVRRRSGRPYL